MDPVDFYESRTFAATNGTRLPYRLFKPAAADPTKRPVLLFLHGAGQRGADNRSQLKHGGAVFATTLQEKSPCFVVAPQCPEGRQWVNTPWTDGSYSTDRVKESDELRVAAELVGALFTEFPREIDRDRVYVMGLSMGGYGTWDGVARHADLFAAAVPICGGGDPSRARSLARLPIWAFHGDADPVVPPAASREMIEALKRAGAAYVKYTEYPGVEHDSWTSAWAESGLWEWLLSQRRGPVAGG
jgi:predicted peptidase